MTDEQKRKYDALVAGLKTLKRVAAAFSGGTDSSFLIYTAREALGKDNVLAVTARSETFPDDELNEAIGFTTQYDISHKIITTAELDTINSNGNPRNRCYFCKKELFGELLAIAKSLGFDCVADGSNKDDDADYRPGQQALRELGIVSPLRDAGFSKADVRDLSREAGLPTWDKPAYACLTSRFPYGVEIAELSLRMIEKAERFLKAQGFRQCRVRCFGEKAVVEVEKEKVRDALLLEAAIRKALIETGFKEVEIDPEGYRMGRMNTVAP
jgi:uncharacterized protein